MNYNPLINENSLKKAIFKSKREIMEKLEKEIFQSEKIIDYSNIISVNIDLIELNKKIINILMDENLEAKCENCDLMKLCK
jgi:hypothetical protein